jgi:PKD repeat protein
VTIGSSTDEVRYQNAGLLQNSCRINSIINDNAFNWSNVSNANINIDWTSPSTVLTVNDTIGFDSDAQANNTTLASSYSLSSDPHSEIDEYWYAIGSSPGDSSIVNWTNNSINTFFIRTGLSLVYGQTYYISVRSKNGAGLWSSISSSDGITIVAPVSPPTADFIMSTTELCVSDSVQITNTTTGASTYIWSGSGIVFNDPNAYEPFVSFSASGLFAIELIANGPGGADTLVQNINVIVHPLTNASFTVSDDTLVLPSGFLACTNTSSNAVNYNWSFGDGNTSTDSDPWNNYTSAGIYELSLIAGNGFCPTDTALQTIVVTAMSGVDEASLLTFQLYPNPVTDYLTVSANELLVKLELINDFGQIVYQSDRLNTSIYTMHLSDLSNGHYILRATTLNSVRTSELLKGKL